MVDQDLGVDDVEWVMAQHALGGHLGEMLADKAQGIPVEVGAVGCLVEDREHGLDRGLRREAGHDRDGAIDRAGAGAYALDVGRAGHAAGHVTV